MGAVFAICIASIIFFVVGIVVSNISYTHRFQIKYSSRRMFPFEYNYKSGFRGNFYGNTAFILSFLALIAFYILFDQKHTNGFLIYALGAGVVACVLMGVLLFLPLYFLRAHALLDIVLFVVNFSIPASMIMGSFKMFQASCNNVHLIFFVLFIIVALACFALMLNPKLSFTFKAVEEVQPDGSVKKVRPRMIVLAFTEWMSYYLIYLTSLIIGVYILFI